MWINKPSALFLLIPLLLFPAPADAQVSERTSIYGWLDTRFHGSNKAGNRPYFDSHHLYLILRSEISKNVESFAEIELEHAPNTGNGKGEIKLERLYSQIDVQSELNFRVGKFNTPFGHWTPQHWDILVETINRPIHEDNHYIPPKSVGVEALGRVFLAEQDIEWHAYLSNGTEFEGTNEPQDASFGGGLDGRLNIDPQGTFVGVSYYHQNNPELSVSSDSTAAGRKENSVIAYAGATIANRFGVSAEYLFQRRHSGASENVSEDIHAYYINGKIYIVPEIAVGTRYDRGDDDKTGIGVEQTRYTIYLNWRPTLRTVAKAEIGIHRFDAKAIEDFEAWGAYLGVQF